VTLEGSPPNAEIYFWTHFKARRSFQVDECHDQYEYTYIELTILEAEIAYLRILDFFPRQEAKRCEANSRKGAK
jgi:hypothetical protein